MSSSAVPVRFVHNFIYVRLGHAGPPKGRGAFLFFFLSDAPSHFRPPLHTLSPPRYSTEYVVISGCICRLHAGGWVGGMH